MSDPAAGERDEDVPPHRPARFPAGLTGLLSALVTVALLVPLPYAAGLVAVAALVAALAALAVAATRAGWRAGLGGQVLWFWGVVAGVGHLMRAAVGSPSGVESAVVGAVAAVLCALCLGLLERARRS